MYFYLNGYTFVYMFLNFSERFIYTENIADYIFSKFIYFNEYFIIHEWNT